MTAEEGNKAKLMNYIINVRYKKRYKGYISSLPIAFMSEKFLKAIKCVRYKVIATDFVEYTKIFKTRKFAERKIKKLEKHYGDFGFEIVEVQNER